jgi:hypothetical protein
MKTYTIFTTIIDDEGNVVTELDSYEGYVADYQKYNKNA